VERDLQKKRIYDVRPVWSRSAREMCVWFVRMCVWECVCMQILHTWNICRCLWKTSTDIYDMRRIKETYYREKRPSKETYEMPVDVYEKRLQRYMPICSRNRIGNAKGKRQMTHIWCATYKLEKRPVKETYGCGKRPVKGRIYDVRPVWSRSAGEWINSLVKETYWCVKETYWCAKRLVKETYIWCATYVVEEHRYMHQKSSKRTLYIWYETYKLEKWRIKETYCISEALSRPSGS